MFPSMLTILLILGGEKALLGTAVNACGPSAMEAEAGSRPATTAERDPVTKRQKTESSI